MYGVVAVLYGVDGVNVEVYLVYASVCVCVFLRKSENRGKLSAFGVIGSFFGVSCISMIC